ncbi:MAG: DMT family transporter [Burkholderiales bacterium]
MKHSSRIATTALLVGATAIAFAPIFVRLSELGPSATAFHRLFLALPALWLWNVLDNAPARTTPPPARCEYWPFVVAGLFFAGDLAVWHWSIKLTSVANATLLANFAPIFVALAGWLLFHERFTAVFLAGMTLALAGAIVLMWQSLSLSHDHLVGDGLGILTAVFYAGYILSVARLRARYPTAKIMAWSGMVTCAALLPVAMLSGESLIAMSLKGWFVLLALALISHAAGQSLIAYALAHLPAAFGSVGLLWQPVAAAGLAWVILNEPLGAWQLGGGALVLAGIYLARRGSATIGQASLEPTPGSAAKPRDSAETV